MRKLVIVFLIWDLCSCSENIRKEGVIETWPNGMTKVERIHLAADTFLVKHYNEDFKLYMKGKTILRDSQEVKHGTWESYYPNGRRWSLNTFVEGVENGIYKTWHPNGNLNISGHYSMGSSTGVWTFFNGEGVIVKTFDATPGN